MKDVYANSACNVAALASSTPEDGLFRIRDPKSLKPPYLSANIFSNSPNTPYNCYVYDFKCWNHEVLSGTLHKRGWVFQEILLAPRVLSFGANQVLWECSSTTTSELRSLIDTILDNSLGKRNLEGLLEAEGDLKKGRMTLSIMSSWMRLSTGYSSRIFTRPCDKLYAFSGIAKLFQDYTPDVYVAGMWKSRLTEMMGWWVDVPQPVLSSKYRAPSWSWASIDGPFRWSPWRYCKYLIQVLDVQFTPGSDPTVDVSNAYIRLKAKSALIIFQTARNADGQDKLTVSMN